MTSAQPALLSGRIVETITSGDFDGFSELFAAEAEIWHSVTERWISVDEVIGSLRKIKLNVPDLHYRDVRAKAAEGGFVQQHLLCGTLAGTAVASPACLVVTLGGSGITRLEEYVDRGVVARLFGR